MSDDYLTTEKAASYLGYKTSTLEVWRQQGKGPKWAKPVRRVIYKKSDLEAWIKESTNAG